MKNLKKLKLTIVVSLTILSLSNLLYAQSEAINKKDIAKIWMGTIKMGETYPRLVFEISTDSIGGLMGTIGIPDKGIKGIPLNEVLINKDTVVFNIAAAMASFKGKLSQDKKSINGIWKEGETTYSLILQPTSGSEINSQPKKLQTQFKIQQSSEHFDFYSADKDKSALTDLSKILEQNYLEITRHMKTEFSNKIRVLIYPNIKEFHKAIFFEEAPDWVVGAAEKDELKMVSPLNPGKVHDYESLMKALVHELVHTVVINIREQGQVGLPKWLNEGYAFYEAKQLTGKMRNSISGIEKSNIPNWDSLSKAGTVEFGDMNGYVFSSLIIEFLIKGYGYEKLRQLILTPEKFEQIYGFTKQNMEEKWINHLLKH